MGIHYTVFVFDDHLGQLNGRSATQEAEFINDQLIADEANLYIRFEYVPVADCLVGELRNCHPSNYPAILGKYDNVYFNADNEGSALKYLFG